MPDPVTRLNTALEGRYRIERELGEGGMATVYLADDLRHARKVALKVLKPELAAVVGAERFLAEIKTTASLQHPHILPLFDSGEAGGFLFYVMPYVKGESLRERLDREHQLPVDEAVLIATNVAEALDYAHRQGVIHRDIKPANVLLQDGKPVVSDFGIALAVGAVAGNRLTETGLSLGTPYYMSPEQATGDQQVGPRSDTYALAAMLYEMLTGDPPYLGSTAQAVLGKILQGAPVSAAEIRKSVPRNVDAALRKALEKLPADRFAGAQDFAKALANPEFRHGERVEEVPATAPGQWNRLSVSMTAVAAGAILVAALSLLSGPAAESSPVVRFPVPVGADAEVYLGHAPGASFGRPSIKSLAFSPDGALVVYSGWHRGSDGSLESRLYQRRLAQERATPLEGAEQAWGPFFSPDGAWIGFFSPEGLQRVSMTDGDIETIAQGYSDPRGGATWGDDGTITWADDGALYRVPATGGEPVLLAARDTVRPGFEHTQPHMLPGSETLLFSGGPNTEDPEQRGVFALDLATGDRTLLLSNAMEPRYVQTGHLLFMRQGSLMAVGFDPDRVEVKAQPFLALADVIQALGMPNSGVETGAVQVAVSEAGHLAYARGGVFPTVTNVLVRLTEGGGIEPLDLDPQAYVRLRGAPDGDRLAFGVAAGRGNSLYVHDFTRRVTQRLNVEGFYSGRPEWSPDGLFVAFESDREDGVRNIYRIAADGSGGPERLVPSDRDQTPMSWSSAGVIVYLQDGDLWILPPDGEPGPFFTSDADESHATFSPNGRWLAYVSDQTGQIDVYVRPYPGPGPPTLISGDGGSSPAWSPDGRQIYFLAPGPKMMVADVVPGDDFGVSGAAPFIDPWTYGSHSPSRAYDVLADGSLIVSQYESGSAGTLLWFQERFRVDEFHVVLNFFEELRTRAGN